MPPVNSSAVVTETKSNRKIVFLFLTGLLPREQFRSLGFSPIILVVVSPVAVHRPKPQLDLFLTWEPQVSPVIFR